LRQEAGYFYRVIQGRATVVQQPRFAKQAVSLARHHSAAAARCIDAVFTSGVTPSQTDDLKKHDADQ
jgi:hypothetical protein